MAQLYEVVVFSSLTHYEGDAIVKKLDPFGCISYSLFRYATHYKKGIYMKDLEKLNRDLTKVIVLGHDRNEFSDQPDNLLVVDEWKGNPDDTQLEDLIDFFEALAFSNTKDVRKIIEKYQGRDLISTFDGLQADLYERLRQNHQGVSRKIQGGVYKLLGWEFPDYDPENPPYAEKKSNIKKLRREEYSKAKDIMTEQLRIEMEKEKQYLAQQKMPFFDLITKGPPPPSTAVDTESSSK